jgi:hypothetical protein
VHAVHTVVSVAKLSAFIVTKSAQPRMIVFNPKYSRTPIVASPTATASKSHFDIKATCLAIAAVASVPLALGLSSVVRPWSSTGYKGLRRRGTVNDMQASRVFG